MEQEKQVMVIRQLQIIAELDRAASLPEEEYDKSEWNSSGKLSALYIEYANLHRQLQDTV